MITGHHEEIDLQELLQAVSTVNFKRLKNRWSVGSYGPDVQIFLAKIDFINYVMDHISPNAEDNVHLIGDFIEIQKARFEKEFKSYYDKLFDFAEPEWGERHNTSVSTERLDEVVKRISKLQDPTLQIVFENELAQEQPCRRRYESEVVGIESRYDRVQVVKDEGGIKSVVTLALDTIKDIELRKAEYRNRPFVTKNELVEVKENLDRCPLYQKVDIRAHIGYNPKASDQKRLTALQRLQRKGGRGYLQMTVDLTKDRIDRNVVATLKSIAYHDPAKEVATLARTMFEAYQKNCSFNPV